MASTAPPTVLYHLCYGCNQNIPQQELTTHQCPGLYYLTPDQRLKLLTGPPFTDLDESLLTLLDQQRVSPEQAALKVQAAQASASPAASACGGVSRESSGWYSQSDRERTVSPTATYQPPAPYQPSGSKGKEHKGNKQGAATSAFRGKTVHLPDQDMKAAGGESNPGHDPKQPRRPGQPDAAAAAHATEPKTEATDAAVETLSSDEEKWAENDAEMGNGKGGA